MESRAKGIIRVLAISLAAAILVSAIKIVYGHSTGSLAFVADGIHSLFDSAATFIGIISVILSSKPPDESHPYGHRKFEAVSTIALGLLLLSAAYEVGAMAVHRLNHPGTPIFSFLGFGILALNMLINLAIARLEKRSARNLSSNFLAADALHNQSDLLITGAVFVSLISVYAQVPYIDSAASVAITLYLAYLAIHLIVINLQPLVDHRVLDPSKVQAIVNSTRGVIDSHNIRSRGEDGHHFLDLNIHLSGQITLERAHEITHDVEARLKGAFPGLVDVVIHTEPHGHPPCTKG